MLSRLMRFCLGFVLLCSASAAFAHSYKQGDIQIGHIWARATTTNASAASVYVPLLNQGNADDALLGGSTSVADQVMLHESVTENGVAKMRMIETLPLLSGKPVAMRPGGKHIMLIGLKQPLREGEKFPLTLRFAHAGAIEVEVQVHAAGSNGGDH